MPIGIKFKTEAERKERIARYNNTEKAKQRRARYSTKYNKTENINIKK